MPCVFGRDRQGRPYPPHPTQQRVFDWVLDRLAQPTDGIPVLYVQHGVRSGGTRAMLNVVLARLTHEPGLRVLIGRKDFKDLRTSILETFLDILPPALLVERDAQEHRYVLRAGTTGTSTVFFRELKDLAGLGSQEFGCILVCEAHEISLAAYRTLKQRCAQQPHPPLLLLEGNAPLERHWLATVSDPLSPDYDVDLVRWTLSSEENKAFLDPGYWASLERMPAAWRRRYLLGEAGPLPDGTPVYPAFVEALHVRETAIIPDRPVIRGWDFGLRRAACVWLQRADSGQLLIHREWLALETPETQFIAGVQLRTQEWFGERVCQDYGDPAARQRDPEGVSTLARLAQAGIHLQSQAITFGERIPLLNAELSTLVYGQPKLVINPSCQVLIEGLMGGYHYPALREDQAFQPARDLPYKDGWYDHVVDAWSYALVHLCGRGAAVVPRGVRRVQIRNQWLARRREAVMF